MQPQDIQLIQEHAGWILEADPEAGLEALLAMNPPLSTQLVKPLLEVRAWQAHGVFWGAWAPLQVCQSTDNMMSGSLLIMPWWAGTLLADVGMMSTEQYPVASHTWTSNTWSGYSP